MRIAVVQYETRNDDTLNRLMSINKSYAQKHNYDYYSVYESGSEHEIPPYWAKVYVMQAVFNDNYDVVLMIDSDACVHNQNIKIEDILMRFPTKSFFYSADPPVYPAKFNAGVMLACRPDGPAIVDDWMRLYKKDRWVRDPKDGSWSCKGPWAGPDYEQGAFIKEILEDPEYPRKNSLQVVPSSFFQGPFGSRDIDDPQFIIHFAGTELKPLMKAYSLKQKDIEFNRFVSFRTKVVSWCLIVFALIIALIAL